jgi:methylmalonyl-CoA mutase cobalamin-binding subunit
MQDHAELYEMGVAAIYGPGTRIPAAALDMIQLLVGPEALAGDTSAAAAAAGSGAGSGASAA